MSKNVKTTQCQNDGCTNLVYYKTKPPKFCSKCKSKKSGGGNSKMEITVFRLLNQLIDAEYINNGYYSWLLSPKGSPMQLDRYYPELGLAFEVQGIQHSIYNSYFFKTKEEFQYLQKCDATKAQICAKKGITLIHIKYNERISNELIVDKLHRKNKKLYTTLITTKKLKTAH